MIKNKTVQSFFIFIFYFLISMFIGKAAFFLSQVTLLFVFTGLTLPLPAELGSALINTLKLPAVFALICWIMGGGQYWLTLNIRKFRIPSAMVFFAVCAAAVFSSVSFVRSTNFTYLHFFGWRWLPAEMASFTGGIAALISFRKRRV